jgi:hypothetical protein
MGHVGFRDVRRDSWSPLAIVSLWAVNILVVLPFNHPFDTSGPYYPHIFLFHTTRPPFGSSVIGKNGPVIKRKKA